jgi:thiol-disulfide isomerase/thioredoxin/tetratricopeptide (TPR) repeat protein
MQPEQAVEDSLQPNDQLMKRFELAISFARGIGLRAAGAALALAGVLALPAVAAAPTEGVPAPTFTLASLSAPKWALANTRGHVVVVNFFATWCPPCRAETPDLVAISKRYASKGVIFVGVDDREDAALVSAFVKSKGIKYPIVLDKDGSVSQAYDVRAIPTTYVLDRDGVIRYRQVDELNAPLLSSVLNAVVAGEPVPQSVASQKFHGVASAATAQIEADLESAKSSTPANSQALDSAIKTGVDANKKLDDMLSQPDAPSISYFDVTATRGKLNTALADAYTARAAVPDSKTVASDQTEAALLRGQVLLDQERFADAATQFDIAMKLAPKDTRAYDGAYMAAYEQKEYAKAADIAAAEAQLTPDDPEAWLTVASSQNALKDYPTALEAERKALALVSQTYAKNPASKANAYELGRVWLKMARTQLLAGNHVAARPLLVQAQAAAPTTIVAQQASEQYVALEPSQIAIDKTESMQAKGESAQPAKVYVIIRNPSSQGRKINLTASGLPPKWLVSFCYSTVCNPYKVSFALPAGGSKRIELLVAPLAKTDGPWSMSVDASGLSTAQVHVDAKTAKAAITISAS